MNKYIRYYSLLTASLVVAMTACADNTSEVASVNEIDAFKEQATQQIKQLATELKQELSASMQAGGPTAAVKTCSVKAPEIAEKLSNDLIIKRTSLKLRNQNNAPDTWEHQVLLSFENQLANGTPIKELVHSEKVATKNGHTLRLMRAIPTQGLCLTCHGDRQTMSAELINAISETYPNDLATGYQVGQIRGAFSVKQYIND